MRQQHFPSTNSSSISNIRRPDQAVAAATETDPLLLNTQSGQHHRGSLRARRRSPDEQHQKAIAMRSAEGYARADQQEYDQQQQQQQQQEQQQQQQQHAVATNYRSTTTTTPITGSRSEASTENSSLPRLPQHHHGADNHTFSTRVPSSSTSSQTGSQRSRSTEYRNVYAIGAYQQRSLENTADHPPLLEIPEEIYTVRKAALKVMKPLIASWLLVSIGFAITVLLGMARWTRLLTELPFWFILLPSWSSHVALLWCHIRSGRALSKFIAEANENRQRPDSTDTTDRTEYLPLLQRSLKFGVKTGVLSFCIFVFEVLLYIKLARGRLSLAFTMTPIWMLVGGAIFDGLVCKTQHFVRLLCWILIFTAMILTVLKMDYGMYTIQWRMVISPIVAVLSICSGTLIYIVYGHQVAYYRLTEAQLTAGILYSMSALICVVLVVLIGEVMPLARPVEIETRLFFVVMAPLVVCLVGMGAWVVSRDEFGRLLLYGGQAAVHPRKLRWEKDGWTSVQSKGVSIIPMFGEVTYCPLDGSDKPRRVELCSCCCSCYPYEEEDEFSASNEKASWQSHPYLAPTVPIRTLSRKGSGTSSFGSSV